jgi:hypothetical protein
MPMQSALILTLMIASEFLFAFVGSVQGLFFFLFMFPPASYVEGTSLTTSLCYQDSRFVGCSWFLGLIFGFDYP